MTSVGTDMSLVEADIITVEADMSKADMISVEADNNGAVWHRSQDLLLWVPS